MIFTFLIFKEFNSLRDILDLISAKEVQFVDKSHVLRLVYITNALKRRVLEESGLHWNLCICRKNNFRFKKREASNKHEKIYLYLKCNNKSNVLKIILKKNDEMSGGDITTTLFLMKISRNQWCLQVKCANHVLLVNILQFITALLVSLRTCLRKYT